MKGRSFEILTEYPVVFEMMFELGQHVAWHVLLGE